MRTTPASRRPTLPGLRLLLPAAILLSLPLALPHTRADDDTAAVGYTSINAGTASHLYLSGGWGLNAREIYVVPFRINTLGSYSLTSLSLLFESQAYGGDPNTSGGDQHGGGPGGGPTYSLYPHGTELSIQVFSSLPDSLTLPASLVTFGNVLSLPNGGGIVTFTPLSSPTLNADTTYYLSAYKPINPYSSISWSIPDWSGSPVDGPSPDPIAGLLDDGTRLPFYIVTADGVTEHYGVGGGFSLTATAVSAVPEPATTAVILGGSVLAAALWVRRRRTKVADPRTRIDSDLS